MTYAIVVSQDSVRTEFLVADINDLDTLDGDIQNYYLNVPTKKKLYFYTGDEWK